MGRGRTPQGSYANTFNVDGGSGNERDIPLSKDMKDEYDMNKPGFKDQFLEKSQLPKKKVESITPEPTPFGNQQKLKTYCQQQELKAPNIKDRNDKAKAGKKMLGCANPFISGNDYEFIKLGEANQGKFNKK